jgi:hypothetical protein
MEPLQVLFQEEFKSKQQGNRHISNAVMTIVGILQSKKIRFDSYLKCVNFARVFLKSDRAFFWKAKPFSMVYFLIFFFVLSRESHLNALKLNIEIFDTVYMKS